MKNVIFGMVLGLLISFNAYAANVTGSVKFTGTASENEVISMNADPTCLSLHKDAVRAETVIVNPNSTLKNVFVYVKEGVKDTTPPPAEAVTIDQKGCTYHPHVFGIQVGQDLEILNSDSTLHNIHSLAEKSKQFNLGMPIQGMKLKKKFEAPEVMLKMKCDVHPWMSAYIGVLPHSFYGVTDDQGKFEIKNLPDGEYTIEAWHEKYGTQTQTVTVSGSDAITDFTFNA